jgi:hypothetical protein
MLSAKVSDAKSDMSALSVNRSVAPAAALAKRV